MSTTSAVATMEATSLFSRKGAEKVLAHGMIGGASSVANGGKFGAGFASMGITQAASISGWFETGMFAGKYGNAIGSGLVGGTASVAAGGDFAMGAVQGAMSRYLNDRLEHSKAVSRKIYETAASKLDSTDYNLWGTKVGLRWFGDPKCNLFVSDVATEAGARVPFINGGKYPPTAGQWADTSLNIPDWSLVSDPQAGDVAAISSPSLTATGHVGIVAPGNQTISATPVEGVRLRPWGFRPEEIPHTVFRRYTGGTSE